MLNKLLFFGFLGACSWGFCQINAMQVVPGVTEIDGNIVLVNADNQVIAIKKIENNNHEYSCKDCPALSEIVLGGSTLKIVSISNCLSLKTIKILENSSINVVTIACCEALTVVTLDDMIHSCSTLRRVNLIGGAFSGEEVTWLKDKHRGRVMISFVAKGFVCPQSSPALDAASGLVPVDPLNL